MTLEEALLAVWRQALEENLNLVELDGTATPSTARSAIGFGKWISKSTAKRCGASSRTRPQNRAGRN